MARLATAPHVSVLLLVFLTLQQARATTCAELFQQLGDTRVPLQCAGATYYAIEDEFSLPVDLAKATAGQYSARFDGLQLFGGRDTRPANLETPFSASTEVSATGDAAGVEEIHITHRGSAGFGSRHTLLQTATFETASRVVFVPISEGDPAARVPVTISFAASWFLQDAGPGFFSRASTRAGASFDLIAAGHEGKELEGLVKLDPAFSADPVFAGEFAATSEAVPRQDGPHGGFDVTTRFELTFDLLPGQQVALDSMVYGSLLNDAYLAGETDSRRIHTLAPALFTIRSPARDVRFRLTPELPSPAAQALKITEWKRSSHDAGGETYSLAWHSRAGRSYVIESSPDGKGWMPLPGHGDVPSQGARTATEIRFETAGRRRVFVRVREQPR